MNNRIEHLPGGDFQVIYDEAEARSMRARERAASQAQLLRMARTRLPGGIFDHAVLERVRIAARDNKRRERIEWVKDALAWAVVLALAFAFCLIVS